MKTGYTTAKGIKTLLAILLFSLFIGCKKELLPSEIYSKITDQTGKADVAFDWYKLQLRILLERNSAINGAYIGYIGIGLYESVRYGIKNSVSFSTQLYQMPSMPAKEKNDGYDWQVSANAALADMVRSFYTGLTPANLASIDSLEKAYNDRLHPASNSATFKRSQTFGKAIAAAIYNWYKTDDINISNVGYVPPVFPGSWVPTPPANVPIPVLPFIGTARTFVTQNLSGIVPAFPFAYSEKQTSDFYKMNKDLYDFSKTLTTEQKDIALFWVDQGNGTGVTPHGHDISITLQTLEEIHASLGKAAEAFAKTGIAERDASIACFRSKYHYTAIRPVTYIQKLIDQSWLPFIPTPPHPEYPAAHSFVTGAVTQALTRVVGENVGFTDHTYDFRSFKPQKFSTINKAAEQAGISRYYGGIHFKPSINTGLAEGYVIGNRVGDISLVEY